MNPPGPTGHKSNAPHVDRNRIDRDMPSRCTSVLGAALSLILLSLAKPAINEAAAEGNQAKLDREHYLFRSDEFSSPCTIFRNVSEYVFLSGGQILCENNNITFAIPNTVVRGSLTIPTTFIGQTSVISILAPSVRFQEVSFVGSWKIWIAPTCSLSLDLVSFSQITAVVSDGGSLTVENCWAQRQAGAIISFQAIVTAAHVRLANTLFEDNFPGTMLSIQGQNSTATLDNVTMRSSNPTATLVRDHITLVLQLHGPPRSSICWREQHP